MKQKKILAIVLSLVMIIAMIPSVALAEVSDIKCDIVLTEGTQGVSQGVLVDFKIQSGSIGIATANVVFTYDTSIFELVDSSGEALTLPTTSPYELMAAQLTTNIVFDDENKLLARENTDGKAQVALLRNANTETAFESLTSIGTCFLAYRAGKDIGDVTPQSLRFATYDEATRLSQTDVIYVSDEEFNEYEYGTNGGAGDTAGWASNITFGKDFAFAKLAPVCNAPTELNAIYGQKLSEITLTNPAGNTEGAWSWVNGEQLVGDVSTSPNTFKAKFTPTDAETYATVTDIDVAVTVSAKVLEDVAIGTILDQKYTGSQITPAVTVTGDGGKTLVKDTDYTVEYGTNTAVAANGGSVTVKAKTGGNYSFTDVTKNFNIVAQAGEVTISGDLNVSYGTVVPDVTVDKHGSDGETTVYYYTNEACTEGKTEVKPTAVGTYWVRVEMAAGINYGSAVSNVLTFRISPLAIPDEVKGAVTGYSATFDGNAHNAVVIDTDKTSDYTIKFSNKENGTYTADNPQVTNVSSTTVWVEISRDNYETVKKSVTAAVSQKSLTLKSATATARDYEAGNIDVEISAVEFNETGALPDLGTGFTAAGKMSDANAGASKTVTVTVTLTDGNYSLAVNTINTTVAIKQVAWTGTKEAEGEAKYGTSGEVDLSGMLAPGGTFGAVSIDNDTDSVLTAVPSMSGSKLQFTFVNDAAKKTKTATVKVPVTSTNYKDYEIKVTLTVLDKYAQTGFKFASNEQTKKYGDADFTVTAKGAVTGSTVTYESSDEDVAKVDADTGKVQILKAGSAIITATASATDDYAEATATYTLTVNPADITVKAKNFKIYVNGTLPDLSTPVLGTHYTVTGLVGEDALGGTVVMKYYKDSTEVAASDVDVTKAGTYDIVISGATAPAGGNYNAPTFVKGTLTIANKSSGGSYIPTIQKPTIEAGEGVKVTLSTDGTVATITVEAGYDLADVVLNGTSKGKVTEVKGLKTGDKLVVTAAKKATEPTKEDILATLADQKLVARSKVVTMKNGKKAVRITWYNQNGEMMEFDGVEIFRSVKRNSGYGKKPIFTSETDKYYNTAVKVGTKYYYKVRGFVEIDGQKYYTDWSLKAWRTVK